ncbi:MAG: DegQ family serine endoprotease [Pseudomonadota bacterium]
MSNLTLSPTRLVLALVAAGALGGGGAAWLIGSQAHATATAASAPAAIAPQLAPFAGAPDFTAIVQRYGPAVVNISVTGTAAGDDGEDSAAALPRGLDPDDPLFQFFKRFGGPGFGPNFAVPRGQPMLRGQGSGFIVSADGLILTNAHVVRGASEVTVKLTDRREFQAKVLGRDDKTDIAVLKIDAKNLPTLPLGNPRDLKVGEWVLAIGSPFGFENSVTAGVVSAKGRSLPDDSYVPFIQTDVAVNPGNSGGPLFNARGEVVGINSQIFSRSGGYQGLSFAIPIDLAVRIKDQIVATGHATHARLGVTVQEVNQALADSFKLPKPEGALIAQVEPGSAADKAGLKTGDVIRGFDGQPIVESGDLPALVGQAAPGKSAVLDIWRNGQREEIRVTLGNASEQPVKTASGDAAGKARLGLALRPLAPEESRAAGVEAGLVVEDVQGPAARAGVQPGDVIVAVNGRKADSVESVKRAVAGAGKSVALLIQRNGQRLFVPVKIG